MRKPYLGDWRDYKFDDYTLRKVGNDVWILKNWWDTDPILVIHSSELHDFAYYLEDATDTLEDYDESYE